MVVVRNASSGGAAAVLLLRFLCALAHALGEVRDACVCEERQVEWEEQWCGCGCEPDQVEVMV